MDDIAEPFLPLDWDATLTGVPDWWLLAAGGGVTPTPEQQAAFAVAHQRITRFRGTGMTPESAAFIRTVVRDALFAAPQPVTKHWVNYSLMVMAGLVRMCEAEEIPVTRESVLSERTRNRFIHVECAGLVPMAQAGYRSRLDIIADALINVPNRLNLLRPTISALDVVQPYDPQDLSNLLPWSATLRPATRRGRVRAVIALGAGVGARRRDMVVIRGTHVSRDEHGVRVQIEGTQPRRVTCLVGYEEMLWEVAQSAGDNLLIAPDKQTLREETLDGVLANVNAACHPPVAIMMRRLRNTWLAHHLTLGTPLTTLLPAAGLETTAHLDELLPYLTVRPDSGTLLRGATA